MDSNEFEELILKYLKELPQKFKEQMKNLDIIVDYKNTSSSAFYSKENNTILLGLFQGLPFTKKAGKSAILPDKIIIYKKSLDAISSNDEELAKNLKRVILHEIGHYFGLDEKKLKDLGY